jgi:hypothetical protein
MSFELLATEELLRCIEYDERTIRERPKDEQPAGSSLSYGH